MKRLVLVLLPLTLFSGCSSDGYNRPGYPLNEWAQQNYLPKKLIRFLGCENGSCKYELKSKPTWEFPEPPYSQTPTKQICDCRNRRWKTKFPGRSDYSFWIRFSYLYPIPCQEFCE